MYIKEYELLNKKELENGQILVEIEKGIWVDYETYKPKPPAEVVNNGE